MQNKSDSRAPRPQNILLDKFGRRLHYLRISLTDRCNLRCRYCMPKGGVPKLLHEDVLTLEEIARVAKVAVSLGVNKIRLTGGEPLLRKNLGVLLHSLSSLEPRPDLRITTNGILLPRRLKLLTESGVSTINVSLDTLKPERYGFITGLGEKKGIETFHRVWDAIMQAIDSKAFGVKINVVALAGFNDDELLNFARLTTKHNVAVRFIEYMPVGRHKPFEPKKFLSSEEILAELESLGETEELPLRPGDGPARRYRLKGSPGELGVISALSSHFCQACNRLRITADGRLVPCLLSETNLDLKPVLRGGATDQDLADALRQGADSKPLNHGQDSGHAHSAGLSMSRLGG